MSLQAVLLPVFIQIGLTFFLLFRMERARVGAVRRGEVRIKDIALGQNVWPEKATLVANAFHNQLQLPVLFYVLVMLAVMTQKADLIFVVMSWLFVGSRLWHAIIHTSSNHVGRRFRAFVVGTLILIAMWIIFALRILLAF